MLDIIIDVCYTSDSQSGVLCKREIGDLHLLSAITRWLEFLPAASAKSIGDRREKLLTRFVSSA